MEEVGNNNNKNIEREEEEENIMPPGFRFHPTDEELVGFYLQRMVQNKPLRIDLIKQIDIYKYHPWDLPMMSNNNKKNVEGGEIGEAEREREGYFMCKRGRKYRNSVRPNRVTTTTITSTTTTTSSLISSSCGFWKATGIDKPIYGSSSMIIGLKKSLVYYRGTAAKPSKTQWMMHEFRLPNTNHHQPAPPEVWTLCRIFKRIPSNQKKCIALLPPPPPAYYHHDINAMLIPPSPPCLPFNQDSLINIHQNHETKLKHTTTTTTTTNSNNNVGEVKDERNHMFIMGGELSEASSPPLESYCYPSFWNPISTSVMSEQDIFASATWDELGSVVHLAMDDSFIKGLLS